MTQKDPETCHDKFYNKSILCILCVYRYLTKTLCFLYCVYCSDLNFYIDIDTDTGRIKHIERSGRQYLLRVREDSRG